MPTAPIGGGGAGDSSRLFLERETAKTLQSDTFASQAKATVSGSEIETRETDKEKFALFNDYMINRRKKFQEKECRLGRSAMRRWWR